MIECSAHDDQLQGIVCLRLLCRELGTEGDDAGKTTDEDIGVHAAFVRFVEDYDAVFREEEVLLDFAEEDAVGHELDGGVAADIGVVPIKKNRSADVCLRHAGRCRRGDDYLRWLHGYQDL